MNGSAKKRCATQNLISKGTRDSLPREVDSRGRLSPHEINYAAAM